MANPTNRHSRARRGKRRAHDALEARTVSRCPGCNEPKLPHRVCPHCGTYRGRQIVEVEEK